MSDMYDRESGFMETSSAVAHARAGHKLQITYRAMMTGHVEFTDLVPPGAHEKRPTLTVFDTSVGDATDDPEHVECATCDFAELDRDLPVEWL